MRPLWLAFAGAGAMHGVLKSVPDVQHSLGELCDDVVAGC